MKISRSQATEQHWDGVQSYNSKLTHISPKQSVVVAELTGEHGEVTSSELERIYYVVSGAGEFEINGEKFAVTTDDLITIPPHATYNYWPTTGTILKVLLIMELWDN